jgi:hypothetical protein
MYHSWQVALGYKCLNIGRICRSETTSEGRVIVVVIVSYLRCWSGRSRRRRYVSVVRSHVALNADGCWNEEMKAIVG